MVTPRASNGMGSWQQNVTLEAGHPGLRTEGGDCRQGALNNAENDRVLTNLARTATLKLIHAVQHVTLIV
jgi:hypothetical protein